MGGSLRLWKHHHHRSILRRTYSPSLPNLSSTTPPTTRGRWSNITHNTPPMTVLHTVRTFHNTTQSLNSAKHYDVTIIGGGVVGSTLARLLHDVAPSLTVALMDARTPRSVDDALGKGEGMTPSARAYAVSPRNMGLWGDGVLRRLDGAGRLAGYDKMQIWESDGPATLHFTPDDIPSPSPPPNSKPNHRLTQNILGAVVEDEPLVSCLWDDLRTNSDTKLLSPVTITDICPPPPSNGDASPNDNDRRRTNSNTPSSSLPPSQSSAYPQSIQLVYRHSHRHTNNSTTASEHVITTDLLVAADGANSQTRKSLGTFPVSSVSYDRTAVTCTVRVSSRMERTAFQRFQLNGPIALLPVWTPHGSDSGDGENDGTVYANVVWSTTPTHARSLLSMSHDTFLQQLNDQLQSGPVINPPLLPPSVRSFLPNPLSNAADGIEALARSVNTGVGMAGWTERGTTFRVPPVVEGVVGNRVGIPLVGMDAERYVGERCVLVGDAAHTVHPMAGQGLNLGLSDAESLAHHLTHNLLHSGATLRSSSALRYALRLYEAERKKEVAGVKGGIEILHRMFGTDVGLFVYGRSLGMNLVNLAGPVRRGLAKVATGATKMFR